MAVVVKVQFSGGCLGRNLGCENAPDSIITELKNMGVNESLSEVFFDVYNIDVDNMNIDKSFDEIEKKSEFLLNTNERIVFLGGDHSITYPIIKSFAKIYKKSCLIMFDAHPDCYGLMKTHEDFIRNIVEDGIVPAEGIFVIGVRAIDKEELKFLREKNIKFITCKEIFNSDIADICDGIMESVRKFDAFYLSIDIDVLESAFAPGTGCIESGGLSIRELLYFIGRIKLLDGFKGGDIVEANPEKDVNGITINTAAKILGKML